MSDMTSHWLFHGKIQRNKPRTKRNRYLWQQTQDDGHMARVVAIRMKTSVPEESGPIWSVTWENLNVSFQCSELIRAQIGRIPLNFQYLMMFVDGSSYTFINEEMAISTYSQPEHGKWCQDSNPSEDMPSSSLLAHWSHFKHSKAFTLSHAESSVLSVLLEVRTY